MKKIYFLLTTCLFGLFSNAQTIIYSTDFNSNNGGFNVITSNGGDNQWQIDNNYIDNGGFFGDTPNQPAAISGFPQSNYMHINSVSIGCGLFNACNAVYYTASITDTSIAPLSPIVTTGLNNVGLSFWYLSAGLAGDAYGTVEYQVGGSGAWTQVGVQLQGKSVWTFLTLTNPVFDNQAQLRFRFRWVNGNGAGADPAFSVDDIKVLCQPQQPK